MSAIPATAREPLWITEAETVALIDMGDAIVALERGLAAEGRGEAENMVKTHATWGKDDTLHAIGAIFPATGFVGTKTWAHTGGGATPLLLLFDAHDGSLKAIIEAFALGQLRTGGISGVATQWLAMPAADELAIIGTGKQAITQVAAVAAVRPLKRVRVFSPTPANRARFADRVTKELQIPAAAAGSVAEAVRDAPIITLVTRATSPFLSSAMVARGAHINAVGAIVPARVEFAHDLFVRCGRVVVDSPPQVQRLSREFMDRYGSDPVAWEAVESLSKVVVGRKSRSPDTDLTLFKAMGMGVSDLSVGIEVYRRAVERGLGRRIPRPERAMPRLRAVAPAQKRGAAS
ncbi:MAG: ornithine cyclodeaminase family protein [Pseudomonadota bacterium]